MPTLAVTAVYGGGWSGYIGDKPIGERKTKTKGVELGHYGGSIQLFEAYTGQDHRVPRITMWEV